MDNLISHNGYHAIVKYSPEDNVLYGRIEAINDLISFEAESVTELKRAFEEAVDSYLATCRQLGKAPDKSYAGNFNVRLPADLHRQAAILSKQRGVSLNQVVVEAVRQFVQ